MELPEWAKKKAIEQFVGRATAARKQKRVENDKLYAGSPMYFYCVHCGIVCDVLPEEYCFSPHRECSQCVGLSKESLIGVAKAVLEASLETHDVAAE